MKFEATIGCTTVRASVQKTMVALDFGYYGRMRFRHSQIHDLLWDFRRLDEKFPACTEDFEHTFQSPYLNYAQCTCSCGFWLVTFDTKTLPSGCLRPSIDSRMVASAIEFLRIIRKALPQ